MRWLILLLLAAGCGAPATPHLYVPYDERFGVATTMDVFLPGGGGDARPAVMLVHGGAWTVGEKEDFFHTATRLAASGYVAATINYRLAPFSPFPAAVQNTKCALT